MSTTTPPRQVPPPHGSRTAPQNRYIPRDELQSFASWQPNHLTEAADAPTRHSLRPPHELERQQDAAQRAHRAGYQEGYRDGLAALASFKEAHAKQANAQLGQLIINFDQAIEELEQSMGIAIARAATLLAQQVLRTEIQSQPAQVAQVAREAIQLIVRSARHITLRVSPNDHATIIQGAGDVIAARGATIVADATMAQGGLMIESDMGSVDACIVTRWRHAAAQVSVSVPWHPDADADADEIA